MSDDKIIDLPGAVRDQAPRPAAKVLPIGAISYVDLDPDTILENNKGRLEGFAFMGYDKNGEFVCGSTYADGGTVLWLIEKLKARLLKDR